ncbi:MAG: hypothetical protein HYZ39_03905 [Mycolicibacterium cosmeticum]|nr:hypothetical protein [Mycolicibacterium cosmeticum]
MAERYRRWNRYAYLSRFERRLNRGLWALLIAGIVYSVLQHVTLAAVPEVFPSGARWGDLIYDLAIAYVGAFAFYLLNIRLPLRRDRRAVYRHIGPSVGLLVTHAHQMMETLNRTAQIEPPDRESSWKNVKELCSAIGPQTPVGGPGGGIFVAESGGLGSHTVFTVMVDRMRRTENGIEKILTQSNFLASDLIDLLEAMRTHTHFHSFAQSAMFAEKLGSGTPGNKDLSIWANQIYNYLRLIDQIEQYGNEFLSMKYEPRPDLPSVDD